MLFRSLEEMVDHTLGRVLDLFGLESGTVRRWGEAGTRRKRLLPTRKA